MGVQGLMSFLNERVPGGVTDINILEEIRDWKNKNVDKKKPTIVIDLSELFYTVACANQKEMHYGGRNQLLQQSAKNFLDEIKKEADLVFFQGRYNKSVSFFPEDTKLPSFAVDKYDPDKFEKFFDNIGDEKDTEDTEPYRSHLGLDYETVIANKYGELHSTYVSNVEELLNYVKNHENILAILVKESNYLLYNIGSTQIWLSGNEYLNIGDFSTKKCDLTALKERLGFFEPLQIGLFAAILTTCQKDLKNPNIKSFKKVNTFFSAEIEEEKRYSFKKILLTAQYVRDKNVFNNQYEPKFFKIVRDIFDNYRNDRLETILRARYESYKIKPVEYEKSKFDKYREAARNFPVVYNILFNKTICLPPAFLAFIDLRGKNALGSKTFAHLILPLFQRVMGIFSQDEPCKIAVADGLADYCFPLEIAAISPTQAEPKVDLDDLNRLIFNAPTHDDELTDQRWRLLFWVLSIDWDDSKFKNLMTIEDDLKPVVVTLWFLRKEGQLELTEADTIMLTELDCKNDRIGDSINFPKKNLRTVRVAHFYVKLRRIINIFFRNCGLSQYAKSLNFDGVHFHNLSIQYGQDDIPVEEIAKYRLYN